MHTLRIKECISVISYGLQRCVQRIAWNHLRQNYIGKTVHDKMGDWSTRNTDTDNDRKYELMKKTYNLD